MELTNGQKTLGTTINKLGDIMIVEAETWVKAIVTTESGATDTVAPPEVA